MPDKVLTWADVILENPKPGFMEILRREIGDMFISTKSCHPIREPFDKEIIVVQDRLDTWGKLNILR